MTCTTCRDNYAGWDNDKSYKKSSFKNMYRENKIKYHRHMDGFRSGPDEKEHFKASCNFGLHSDIFICLHSNPGTDLFAVKYSGYGHLGSCWYQSMNTS